MRTTTTTTTDTISKFAAFAYISFRHLSVNDLIFLGGFLLLLLLLLFVKREGDKRRKERKLSNQIKSNQTNLLFASREGVEDVQPIVVLFRSVPFPPPKREKQDEIAGR